MTGWETALSHFFFVGSRKSKSRVDGRRLRVVYAVANLTHCAREHLKREEDQNGPFQILRVVYQSSKVLDMLKRLREEEDVELVRGLFLLLNILLHDPLDKNSKIYPFQVELAQVLISLEWCDSIIGGLSHHDDQVLYGLNSPIVLYTSNSAILMMRLS